MSLYTVYWDLKSYELWHLLRLHQPILPWCWPWSHCQLLLALQPPPHTGSILCFPGFSRSLCQGRWMDSLCCSQECWGRAKFTPLALLSEVWGGDEWFKIICILFILKMLCHKWMETPSLRSCFLTCQPLLCVSWNSLFFVELSLVKKGW